MQTHHQVRTRRSAILAVAGMIIAGVVGITAPAAQAAPADRISAGQVLTSGQSIQSSNGVHLSMQTDGNLVLYTPENSARWQSGTAGNPGARVAMQSDGNLVIYSSNNAVLWQLATNGSGAAYAVVQNDGNFVLYTNTNKAVYQSMTSYHPSTLSSPGTLDSGKRLQSKNGSFEAVMQGDGNVVVYGPGNSVWWQSGTAGSGGTNLAVQADGNMVLYNAAGAWKWQTNTGGNGASYLAMQDDGNLVLYTAAGRSTWQSGTHPMTKGQQVVAWARTQLGIRYELGGSGPASYDCSGLVKAAWAKVGVSLPRSSANQYSTIRHITKAQLQPGDLVFWSKNGIVNHVAIWAGNGKIIEATTTGMKVREAALWGSPSGYGRPAA